MLLAKTADGVQHYMIDGSPAWHIYRACHLSADTPTTGLQAQAKAPDPTVCPLRGSLQSVQFLAPACNCCPCRGPGYAASRRADEACILD